MTSEEQQPVQHVDGVEYYWCVNCGHAGKYAYRRLTGHSCQNCRYDVVVPFEKEEILEDETLNMQFREVLK